MTTIVPPIKCQGIKTKLIPLIRRIVAHPLNGRWIEPFCGSCVVALNLQPDKALLADTNPHIIGLYRAIQAGVITPHMVRLFLEQEGRQLEQQGETYYYEVRRRFNATAAPLDFLFLNRSCFNGVMRFNRHGAFNVPFCRKPERFGQAYITKIVNQVARFAQRVSDKTWEFVVADFRDTLNQARVGDIVYADPPYAGRHVDYFNSWHTTDEARLSELLQTLPCHFILSTWHSNAYRENETMRLWANQGFFMHTIDHFYHVGPTEDLRNAMVEALITNVAPAE